MDLPAERPARARSAAWPRSRTQSSQPCWVWSEPSHNPWASLRGQREPVKTCLTSVLHVLVCLPSPRWRSLCWGCRLGVSVFAAAGRDALLNSRDRRMSRGGSGTAIILHRITGRHTSRPIYTRQQTHAGVHRPVHIQYKHTTAHLQGQWAAPQQRPSAGLFSCISFHCCWEKKACWGVPSALSHTAHIVCSPTHTMDKGTQSLYTNTHQVTSDLRDTLISEVPDLHWWSSSAWKCPAFECRFGTDRWKGRNSRHFGSRLKWSVVQILMVAFHVFSVTICSKSKLMQKTGLSWALVLKKRASAVFYYYVHIVSSSMSISCSLSCLLSQNNIICRLLNAGKPPKKLMDVFQ